ncbi:MAG: hypothetical protein KME29_36000 [Calothrix sp. FI2-JRJ7]|jgi:hypothetical protein|nr:hypothetical protein [Calothrix sp. FI2-JRJ7]
MTINKVSTLFQNNFFLLPIYLFPLILVLLFVDFFGVNAPFWDEWALPYFFQKVISGNANISDFFAQHNEHRILFPRILFLLNSFISKWNVKIQMYLSIFLVFVSFCNLYLISANVQNKRQNLFHLTNISTSFLIFSLAQWENWLWGFQITFLVVNTCITSAILFLSVPQKMSTNKKIIFAATCCCIASFSVAHGLLSWIALIPSLAFLEGNKKEKLSRIAIWIILFILSISIYLIGYEKPSISPDVLFFFKEPFITFQFMLIFLAAPFGKLIIPTVILGAIILFNWLIFNILFIKNYDSQFAYEAAPWFSLGWFAVLYTLMTTIGRAGWTFYVATNSRYTTTTILLYISLLQIWQIYISHYFHHWQPFTNNLSRYFSSYFFATILIFILIPSTTDAFAKGEEIWLQRNQGETCLEIVNFLDKSLLEQSNSCINTLFFKPVKEKQIFTILEQLGLREFAKGVKFLSKEAKTYGAINITSTVDQPMIVSQNSNITISGWTTLFQSREQPSVVLLSYGNNQSFFANATVKLNRFDLMKFFNQNLSKRYRWDINLPVKLIPLDSTVVKAWVYNSESKQFLKLDGELNIQKG